MASIRSADDLDLSAIRVFLTAVELGSVSKAARRLQIAQPSATAKLQKLERALGQPLLERAPTGSIPTEAGARLFDQCTGLLVAAGELLERAEALRTESTRLAVATTRHVADHFLPRWLADGELDDLRLALVEADTLRVAQTVRAGDAAIGFAEGPAAPIGLRSRVVASEPIEAFVGRTHRWYGRRRPLEPADLGEGPVILTRPGSGTRDTVEAALAERGLDRVGDVVEVTTPSEVRLAAVNGGGVGFLPRCWVAEHLAAGTLARVPIRAGSAGDLLHVDQTVRVVWRGSRPAASGARRLLALVAGE